MPLGDRTDMVYMNTSVTRGTGDFAVTATGMATEVGHISGMLQAQPTVKRPSVRLGYDDHPGAGCVIGAASPWSWVIGAGKVGAAFPILAGFTSIGIWTRYPLLLDGKATRACWWRWDASDLRCELRNLRGERRDLRVFLEPPGPGWLLWMQGLGMSELA